MGVLSNPTLVKWMDEEDMGTEFIKCVNWPALDLGKTPQKEIDRIVEPISKFFMSHTKSELWEEGVKRRVMVFPVADTKDILNDIQLKSREFWVALEHPELDDRVVYPGAFVKTEEKLCGVRRRAPLVGEHNAEIYEEVGFSKEEIVSLKQCGVI
jgi:crotonobetainyl-CoA:carnitine CoA-transferase CaiB-like acyl-CoA transferase